MKQTLKIFIGDSAIVAKRGIVVENNEADSAPHACPHCRVYNRKFKLIATMTQFGFEWDETTDFRLCKCKGTYFVEFKTWHDMATVNLEMATESA